MRLAAERLVRAFAGTPSRVGLVLFSGPRNSTTLRACSRGAQPGEPTPRMEQDCKIQWVSHLTDDMDGLAQKVQGLTYPRGTSLTSSALATAAAEMSQGRADAGPVVIVISDGRVMSPKLTRQAATFVKDRARLLWVPVSTYAKISDLKEWVSKPVRENVVRVKGFDKLKMPEAVSEIVSRVCPLVA
uniref:VWFA domain-containing protein n=1 Tax=Alexandrium andersonii TaxID=327968 RepID=A0A7S2H4Q8_9DINO|mmetsp:Transcript_67639/g.151466  ORF Transcript_67639/g.151466 Transcript_67639/m.151466 type:complete len:187 (+) Transcript_67639:3-563(+)